MDEPSDVFPPQRRWWTSDVHRPSSASTVEQEQIQKKTFTNWVNAQLAKVSGAHLEGRVVTGPRPPGKYS